MLWDEKVESYRQLEQFLKSCLDPTTDEADFTTALRSVPQDSWSTVQSRVSTELHKRKSKCLPPLMNEGTWQITSDAIGESGNLITTTLDTLEMKERVLSVENQHRLPK